MQIIALAVALAALPMQPPPASGPYKITHTYTLGGDGGWDYVVPDPPIHRVFIGRQNRVMVVDENDGKLLGEVTGINGAHGTAIAEQAGHGFATSGNDSSVVMFDLETTRRSAAIPRRGRRRRDHLRSRVEPRVHLQRRRALVDGRSTRERQADHEHRSRRQAGIRRVRRRRKGLREPHRQRAKSSRSTRRLATCRAAGRRRRASSRWRWRSTPSIIGCSAAVAAA